MGTRLNKRAYTKLIEENIAELEKYMPEHSLEKKHTIDLLKWSINEIYKTEKSDTIEFAEWIRDNSYIYYENRKSPQWTINHETKQRRTTKELYKIFKNSK